ncbi:uncharacterized protein K452DRAFT_265108 [Aplosporella prunicola CBS 121167]|uniref:Uncharacterized protein n=1 Tax=Aplosporella prunicola CBS 121167 TaxID=1176127 RepID=A0A6A6BQS7_9PEZI|nr:uncharacterized protein K452DRAFT_265108 [Aplosporella prunicola CBS 121167]KAF2145783.1 hypothetical protein K452DRAFT_265108 [Aplosporella prunicola CBS 121167]
MATTTAPFLYREARLNLDPPYAGSTIGITLPPHNSSFLSRTKAKRVVLTEDLTSSDETAFARRHLAPSEASIFFRRKHPYPRSFQWRILDDRKVLELRSVDLSIDRQHKGEAVLTILLSFPNPIRPFGVAFAEPDERDALNIFVLTTANELYTLNLHKEFFVRPAATEIDVEDWCKTYSPSAFSFRYPYRIVATSAQELLVSLHDGGLLRLTRKAADDGSQWRETFFTEGGWGSTFKSLIPWKGHNTVRFGNLDLEASTAASIALSPDNRHIYTVSLNHTLKAWNLETGRVGVHTDLLGENDRDPQKLQQFYIAAAQPHLMQVVNMEVPHDGDEYYVATYSPKRHQFKFWGIRDADDAELGIHDVHSDFAFIPPIDELMNTTVWNMEEFFIKATPGWRDSEVWIRVRSGPNCRIFGLKFDLFDSQGDLADKWRNNWVAVDSGSLTAEALKSSISFPSEPDPEDSLMHSRSLSEEWLDFLFYPGRFTSATLETSLCVYRRGVGEGVAPLGAAGASSKAALKEQISAAVASRVSIRRRPDSGIDHDQHELDIAAQWQVFYGVVRDLHKRRGETIGLAFDAAEDAPWILLSDYASPVRKCSEIELLRLNHHALITEEPQAERPLFETLRDDMSLDVSKLLYAASEFRRTFPSSFKHELSQAVASEVLQEPSFSVFDRLRAFEARCNLCGQVGDDEFEKLEVVLEELGGFAGVNSGLLQAVFDRLGEDERGRKRKRAVTAYGARTLIRGVQETLELTTDVLLDLLVLVVFMSQELDPADVPFDSCDVFAELVSRLKGITITHWLASTLRADPPRRRRGSLSESDLSPSKQGLSETSAPTVTMFESLFIGDWSDLCFPEEPQSSRITYSIRAWIFCLPLPENYDFFAAGVMSNLLKYENLDLATNFLPFLPQSPWATYLRARYYLAIGDYMLAGTYFKKAAFGSGYFDIHYNDTYGYLSPDEREYFSDGLARYYQHVMNLFDRAKVYSSVVEFGRLALQSFGVNIKKDPTIKTEVLSRLFNALIQTSRFREAHTALTRYSNAILRKAALTSLVKTMVVQSRTADLIALPFASLHSDVDAILAQLCKDTLNVATGPPYHKVLYSYRIARNDFRGAASILYERLQRLHASSIAMRDPKDDSLSHGYLLLINTLASVSPDEAYILAEARVDDPAAAAAHKLGQQAAVPAPQVLKRRILTLEDVRREYQTHLDRVEAMETGRFAFGAAEEMDIV